MHLIKAKSISLSILIVLISACAGGSGDSALPSEASDSLVVGGATDGSATKVATDITSVIFQNRDTDCASYEDLYSATALDEQRSLFFEAGLEVTAFTDFCRLSSNGIPNHDFNDATAHFATPVSEVNRTFDIPRNPAVATEPTALDQRSWDAIMLNGVVLDLLSAGCYSPSSPMADSDGNVAIGCRATQPWLLDPLAEEGGFGTDAHHAHTQPDGTYHYHGDPEAMFDDSPGPFGSPVIGFAADGFPIYGSYFLDGENNLRKAVSGYRLKSGTRPGPDSENPGGAYDGTYIDDYEYTAAGDLDECNGMSIDGQYGYYVTDAYPWVLNCFTGNVDPSFNK